MSLYGGIHLRVEHDMTQKKNERPDPSPTEWLVLQTVWDLTLEEAEVTVSEVLPRMAEKRGWHVSTLKSTLERLVQKGYLSRRIRGKTSFYKPEVPREEATSKTLTTFLDIVLDGAFGPLVAYLADRKGLKETEIEELERLLNKVELEKTS
jgi:BlaI family transcriptional regulator, penicillinase repressor